MVPFVIRSQDADRVPLFPDHIGDQLSAWTKPLSTGLTCRGGWTGVDEGLRPRPEFPEQVPDLDFVERIFWFLWYSIVAEIHGERRQVADILKRIRKLHTAAPDEVDKFGEPVRSRVAVRPA